MKYYEILLVCSHIYAVEKWIKENLGKTIYIVNDKVTCLDGRNMKEIWNKINWKSEKLSSIWIKYKEFPLCLYLMFRLKKRNILRNLQSILPYLLSTLYQQWLPLDISRIFFSTNIVPNVDYILFLDKTLSFLDKKMFLNSWTYVNHHVSVFHECKQN